MKREKAKKILIFCRYVDSEIKYNAEQIQYYEDKYYMNGSGNTDINSSIKSKNKISKPTEATALNVPDFVKANIHKLHELNKNLAALETAIMYELNELTIHQKTILYDFYIVSVK